MNVGLGDWISTGVISPFEKLPDDETPVLILFCDGKRRIGALNWERPGYEDTFAAFQYWGDPDDEGQIWAWDYVIGWLPLPEAPNVELSSREWSEEKL